LGSQLNDIPVTLYPRVEMEARWAQLANDPDLQEAARAAMRTC